MAHWTLNQSLWPFLKGAVHPPSMKLHPIFDQALLMDCENAELRVIEDN